MSFRRKHRWLTGALPLLWLTAGTLCAHGPLDNSASITVAADRLEVGVILGPDAAQSFFTVHLPGIARPQPVGRGVSLPVEAVTKLFSLARTNELLTPGEFRVLTDGLEYMFVATFPRPEAASLSFQAHYFALAEQMPPGAVLVQTEDRQRLGGEVFSYARTSAEMLLPSAGIEARPMISPPKPAPTTVSEPIGLTNQPRVVAGSIPGQVRFASLVTIGLVAAILVGFLLSHRRGG